MCVVVDVEGHGPSFSSCCCNSPNNRFDGSYIGRHTAEFKPDDAALQYQTKLLSDEIGFLVK